MKRFLMVLRILVVLGALASARQTIGWTPMTRLQVVSADAGEMTAGGPVLRCDSNTVLKLAATAVSLFLL